MPPSLDELGRLKKVAICIDARFAENQGTGVSRYATTVEAALVAYDLSPIRLTDASYGRFGSPDGARRRAQRWLSARFSHSRRLAARDGGLWRADIFRLAHVHFLATGKLLHLTPPMAEGVMHWSYPIPALVDGWINVHTVHDVIPLTHPHLSSVDPQQLHARIAAIAAGTQAILTVSQHARAEILAQTGIAPGRVLDCGSGVSSLDHEGQALPDGLMAGQYLLAVGLIEPRKNLDRLMAAWQRAAPGIPLVIAGPDGVEGREIRARLRQGGCMTLPFQSRPALIALIAGARALLFPSLAEGFGLPIAEAMALNVPVVTSSGGACGETAGDAAMLIDPMDVDAMAGAIGEIASSASRRTELIARGKARRENFGVSRFGERLIAAYAGMLPNP